MMKLLLKSSLFILLFVSISSYGIEKDKWLHFGVSTAGSFSISLVTYAFTGNESKLFAATIGGTAMFLIGFSKEIMDLKYNMQLDRGDIAANLVGVLTGTTLFLLVAPDKKLPLVLPQLIPTQNGTAFGLLARISL